MSQKSSVPQPVSFVSQVLKREALQRLAPLNTGACPVIRSPPQAEAAFTLSYCESSAQRALNARPASAFCNPPQRFSKELVGSLG